MKAGIPGEEHAITSNEIFHLEKLPKSILIVGGGYIACEFAGIMNGLGVKTTQYYRGAQILRGFDDEARGLVSEEMIRNGVELHLGTNVIEMEKTDSGVHVKATNGDKREFDVVLFATGRAPIRAIWGLKRWV